MPIQLDIKSPKKSLNKAYLKETASRSSIEKCKEQLLLLLGKADPASSEDTLKDYITDFLKNTWYSPEHAITINKEKKDFSIHTGKTAKDPVAVIAEVKKTDSAEMITTEKPNVKALHELVLYYMQERVTGANNQVKYLVATDVQQWYLIDANEFDKKIYSHTRIKKLYDTYVNDKKDNPFFYDELKRILGESDITLTTTFFRLDQYEQFAVNADQADDTKLVPLLKILSPAHLLKLPFANDSNSLDKYFYEELLHIIGLEEIKEGSKKLIQRKKEPSEASLLENAIIKLRDKDCLRDLPDATRYGLTGSEQEYNIALELCITWINRILFLKLLEGQLVAYHQKDNQYQFLNEGLIPDFDELNNLFFQVLAEVPENRRGHLQAKFSQVPYLNSSLFERTELERRTIDISALDNGLNLPLHTNTVFKDSKGKRVQGAMTTLAYLFSFLDRYNFTSEGKADIQDDNKRLINASVLGLIFEKINGYKDGSFFTPGFITMYMCRETLRRAVTQKFNGHYGWTCENFEGLQERIDFQDKDKRAEANNLINSLTICDPAVGSGHFLVSALNELISIKHDLKILQYRHNGQRIREYSMEIANDELVIQDVETEDFFEYTLNQKGNSKAGLQALQETLFHEKETLIENCLFGVDINANSVKICRLRLWIELLKNAYYTSESQYTRLETLPNIDINIKQGNSLISRFALDADLTPVLEKSKYSIESYKVAVQAYRNAESKQEKRELETLIEAITNDFQKVLSPMDPINKKLSKLRGEMESFRQTDLFSSDNKKKTKASKELEKLSKAIEKLETEKAEINNNAIYKDSFEWRFMFPEVLDNEGVFLGFDVVIGNPPYIYRNFDFTNSKKYYESNFASNEGNFDLYKFFIERILHISKSNGLSSFIVPNTFLSAKTYSKLRELIILNFEIDELYDLGLNVFDGVTVENIVFRFTKKSNSGNTIIKVQRNRLADINNPSDSYELNIKKTYDAEKAFNIYLKKDVNDFILKLRNETTVLGEIAYCTVGINTGYIKSQMTANEKIDKTYHKMLNGKDIGPYIIKWPGQWIKYDKAFVDSFGELGRALPPEYVFKEPKILVQRTRRGMERKLVCTYDDQQFYNLNRISNIVVNNKNWSAKYIISLLNSKVLDYYFNKVFNEYEVKPLHLAQLPIKRISLELQLPFITLVDQILAAKKADPAADTSKWEAEIDELVFDLYGLTEEEKGLVRGA